MKVLFATKCWGGDWQKFLAGAFERKVPDYPLCEKWLLINNSVPPKVKFKVDKTIRVEDYAERALNFFNLKESDFKGGYVYSIAELVCLYLAKDFDYLVWIQGDVMVDGKWVKKALQILRKKHYIAVVSPSSEVNTYHDELGLDQEFSDQCFVVRVREFRQQIYNYKSPNQKNYPDYGGHSFEYKCGQYLKNNNKFRKILTCAWAHHPAYD